MRARKYGPAVNEHFKVEMSFPGVVEDKAGKEREADNPVGLSMQRDAASRRRRQHECDRSTSNCSKENQDAKLQTAHTAYP